MVRASERITASSGLTVEGLADFQRGIRKLAEGKELTAEIKAANTEAAETIVEDASNTARGMGGAAAKTIRLKGLRAAKSVRNASVTLKNTGRTPFGFGAEFGAKQYRQFEAWRGNQWESWEGGPGYFLHPAIERRGNEVLDEYWKRIEAVVAVAFPE